jgi:hypothetical protein
MPWLSRADSARPPSCGRTSPACSVSARPRIARDSPHSATEAATSTSLVLEAHGSRAKLEPR